MSTIFVASALLFAAPPLQFTLKAPLSPISSGQPVRCELIVKNVSEHPLVVAKAIWDGAPAATLTSRLTREGAEVAYFGPSSMPAVQVEVSDRVDKNRFVTLAPGKSHTLYWVNLEGEYAFPAGSRVRDKRAYAEAKRRALPPGKYEFEVAYRFDPKGLANTWKTEWSRGIRFDPGAEKLWKAAAATSYRGSCSFVIE